MTETRTGIRQSDFAEKHGLNPGEVKDLREQHLEAEKDYWSVVRAIFWTEEAVSKVESLMGKTSQKENKEAEPSKVVHVQAFQKCPNKRMLYAKLDGERIVVFCGSKRDSLVGKKIPVRKADNGEHYNYAP